jgi:hypothetical protein
VLPPPEQRWWQERFAAAIEALGSAKCGQLLEEGRSLSPEAAMALALAGSDQPPRGRDPAGAA